MCEIWYGIKLWYLGCGCSTHPYKLHTRVISCNATQLLDPISSKSGRCIYSFVKFCASVQVINGVVWCGAHVKSQQVYVDMPVLSCQPSGYRTRTKSKIWFGYCLCAQACYGSTSVKSMLGTVSRFLYVCGYGSVGRYQHFWSEFSV